MDKTKVTPIGEKYEWWTHSGIKYDEFKSVLKSIFPNITSRDVFEFGNKMVRESAGDDNSAHALINKALDFQRMCKR